MIMYREKGFIVWFVCNLVVVNLFMIFILVGGLLIVMLVCK